MDPVNRARLFVASFVAHVRGALEGRQPPIEHAKIAGYSAMAVLARRWAPPAGA